MVKVHIGSMKWDDAQVKAAVDAWLAEHPPMLDSTLLIPYISQAVTDYITANPPADGQDATDAQVAAAVDAWFDINQSTLQSLTSGIVDAWLQENAGPVDLQFFVNSWLEANPPADGQDATDAQVIAAVNDWLIANPPADGQNATPEMVETAVNDWLTLNPPQDGDPGPANSLSIGTVVSGPTAAASIQGEPPAQQLNLTLPQGPEGPSADVGTGWRDITSDFVQKTETTTGLQVIWRAKGDICEIRFKISTSAVHSSWQLTTDGPGTKSYTPWLPGGVSAGASQVIGNFISSSPLLHGPARIWGTSIGIGNVAAPSIASGISILGHLWWRRPDTDPGTLPGSATALHF